MQNRIAWKALEYKRTEKTADWYWAVGIIALSTVITAFILKDGLFAILIVIGVSTLMAFSLKKPEWVDITIDRRGFSVGSEQYPFATLSEFWVDISTPNDHKIIIKSKKGLMPLIIIPIEEHEHLDVREFLLKHLPEKELHEPAAHKIMERLGF